MTGAVRHCRSAGRGVVGAQVPEAVAAGCDALASGGNAYDAVLAAAFVETVALPPKCGFAGDVVALVVDGCTGSVETLVSIGPVPARVVAAARHSGGLPATGGLAVGVPGAPAGYAALAGRARLDLGALVAPAADLARSGVRVGPVLARLTHVAADLLRRHQPDGCRYLPAGRPVVEGDTLVLPGLAAVLDAFAQRRWRLFDDEVGAAVAATVAAAGGVLQPADLVAPAASWVVSPWRRAGDVDLAVTPAPTYGPLLADAVERRAVGGAAPVDAVLATEAARDALAQDGGTSVVAATDDDVAVVLVHSNSFPEYGAGLVVADYDLVLGNRPGRGFRGPPSAPTGPAAGARPPTTLHAWALRTDAGDLVAGATPGGENQLAWNVQQLDPLLGGRGDAPVAALEGLARPRWARQADGTVATEPGCGAAPDGSRREVAAVTSSHVLVGRDPSGWWAAADSRQTASVAAPGSDPSRS